MKLADKVIEIHEAKSEYGFEVWNGKGSKMLASGKAKGPDQAVEFIKKAMKKAGDKSAEGLITQGGESIDTKKYDDLF